MKTLPQLIREDWRDERCGYRWMLWFGAVWALWPAMMVTVYAAARQQCGANPDDATLAKFVDNLAVKLEVLGPILLATATALYFIKLAVTRNLTYCVIGAIVGILLFREIYWDVEGRALSKGVIFPVLGLAMCWLLYWRALIDKPWENKLHTLLFFGAISIYFCGQLVERRALKGILPDEARIHTALEESGEVVAHSVLILAALLGSWARRKLTITKS